MKKYFTVNTKGEETPVTAAQFNKAIEAAPHFILDEGDETTAFVCVSKTTNYMLCVDNATGYSETLYFTSATFYALDHKGAFCHVPQGDGVHVLLPNTPENAELARMERNAEAVIANGYSRDGRCLDDKGRTCAYVRDANDKAVTFINKEGKLVKKCANCTKCFRTGELAGDRENCCLKNVCPITDCAERGCPYPKSGRRLTAVEDEHLNGRKYANGGEIDSFILRDTLGYLAARLEGLDAEIVAALVSGKTLTSLAEERCAAGLGKNFESEQRKISRHHKKLVAEWKKELAN